MSVLDSHSAYAFGPFVLHLQERVLYRLGLPVELQTKLFDILRCLLDNGDRVVSKETLVQEVWDGTPIGDNNIAQHVHLVRQILGDVAKPYRYIATVHGRGYRFVADFQPVSASSPLAPASVEPARAFTTELISNAGFFLRMGTPAAVDSSIELCRRALQIDTGFADAHAGIAIACLLKAAYFFGDPAQQFALAREHALQATRLDSRCARAQVAMAALALLDDFAPARSLHHLAAAAAISPDLPGIAILRICALVADREYEAARSAALEATVQHESSTPVCTYAAFASYQAGELDEAATMLERLLIFKPGAAFGTYLLGLTRLAQGDYFPARDVFHTLLAGRISVLGAYEKFRMRATAALAFIEARSGSPEDARLLARDVQRSPVCSYVALALARAGLGEEDSVIACLERARAQRDPWFPFVASDPVFREFRDVPEFQAVTKLAPRIVNHDA